MLTKAEAHHLEMLALHYQDAVHHQRENDGDPDDNQYEVQHTLGLLLGAAYTYMGDRPAWSTFEEIAIELLTSTSEEHVRAHAGILGSIQALTERTP